MAMTRLTTVRSAYADARRHARLYLLSQVLLALASTDMPAGRTYSEIEVDTFEAERSRFIALALDYGAPPNATHRSISA